MAVENTGPHYEGMDLESALKEAGHYDEVPDDERGCGSLDPDSVYLRSDVDVFGVGKEGTIPTFVTFDRPVPYREGHFRTFKRINGTEFLLDATQHITESPENEADAHRERVRDDWPAPVELPEDEILSYIERVNSEDEEEPEFTGSPFLNAMNTMDLLMWVGQSYYPTPEAFINEAKAQGVSKKIPVSGNQAPPRIRPFRTRLFLIHPKAIPTGKDASGEELDIDPDDDDAADWEDQEFIPGIVGYSYLTRSVHTADVDGGHPEWAERYEDQGLLDRVDIGEFTPKDSPDHPLNADNDEADTEEATGSEVSEAVAEALTEGEAEAVDAEEATTAEEWANREWSEQAQSLVDEMDEVTPEAFKRDLKSATQYQQLRTLTSKVGLGSELGPNPSGDEMLEMLSRIPVFQGPVGDDTFYVDVDGAAYPVNEFADADKVARAHAKFAALGKR